MAYKRPGELSVGGALLKRRKASVVVETSIAPRHKLQRSASENAATVLSSTLNNRKLPAPGPVSIFCC